MLGYRIEQDQGALLLHVVGGRVLKFIDLFVTGKPGGAQTLSAYNGFCAEHGGSAAGNQTWGAPGAAFARVRRPRRPLRADPWPTDPDDQILNGYFGDPLRPGGAS